MSADILGPGDVLVMAVPGGWRKKLVRFFINLQARLTGSTAPQDHVAVLSHQDDAGNWWAIEGKPSSVGFVLADKYLRTPLLVTNAAQPKTDEQRELIVRVATELLGTPYDWTAIATLGVRAARVNELWDRTLAKDWGEDEMPVHVICSSLADLAYEKAGLPSPGGTVGTRFTRPADWTRFCQEREWEAAA
ncbi:hypothetical protein [Actinoplanes sp. URMC 104]|uniref:hypothetical protein n=1 Tax=Actinoplanes sp. URMC 104 TaxID=3423409 RepID=UPI003F1A9FD7